MEQPNRNYINELSGGNKEFEDKLIHVIKSEWPDEVEEYHENMKNSAFAKAAQNVHKIKHKLGIVGLVEGYELAVQYELQLKDGNTIMKEQFQNILNVVTRFINGL
ncbi:Hpt domain-containing protein [Nonlabens sp. Hel1_33_55]|uniref:Hpt domain-containing protein n=1 Tax=Nonlabens sp. Hel1_33_55 TaxID=1336802 RepID=UPI000875DB74|nr:Hpt domain-containing protein [Nonlabens sp. Hel1_33_55]SCX99223.1 Hpt domain-containing protein [Nonlabens sp. Hel1_33_55]